MVLLIWTGFSPAALVLPGSAVVVSALLYWAQACSPPARRRS